MPRMGPQLGVEKDQRSRIERAVQSWLDFHVVPAQAGVYALARSGILEDPVRKATEQGEQNKGKRVNGPKEGRAT